jgi:hypothetical protein
MAGRLLQTQTADLLRSPVPALTGCGSGLSTYLFFYILFLFLSQKMGSAAEETR